MHRSWNDIGGGFGRAALLAGLLLLPLAAPAPAQQAGASNLAAATDSRLGGDHKRTRFVVDLDREVPFRVFALADPYRVIVDLPQLTFQFKPGTGQAGRGLISAYRYGLLAFGKSRIVLDADRPVAIDKAFVLPAQDGQPSRLVVDMVATTREAFLKERAREQKQRPQAAAEAVPAVRKHDADELVIVIDPGHGGIDSGAVSPDGTEEKEIVLAFANSLRERLQATGRFKILMTRDSDVFLPLRQRVAFARENGASLFISIHADKFHQANVRGATVYTLSERASDAEAAALASKENKADVIAGIDLADEPNEVSDILIDLARRETKNFSVRFAKTLVGEMNGEVQLNKNPHRFAGFRVLTAADVPSVLLEIGYVSNSKDVRALTSASWRSRATAAIHVAVNKFFGLKFASTPE